MDTSTTSNQDQRRPYTGKQRRLIAEAADTHQQIAMYQEILDIARRYDHGPEIERTQRCLTEWEAETDDIIGRAIQLGLGPDDLYDPAPSINTRPALSAAQIDRHAINAACDASDALLDAITEAEHDTGRRIPHQDRAALEAAATVGGPWHTEHEDPENDPIEPCGCPTQVLADEDHQPGCQEAGR